MNIYVKVHQDLRLKKGKITVEKATYSDRQLRMSEKNLYMVLEQVKKAIEDSIVLDETYEVDTIGYVHVMYEG